VPQWQSPLEQGFCASSFFLLSLYAAAVDVPPSQFYEEIAMPQPD
jgi:hypothetical protein